MFWNTISTLTLLFQHKQRKRVIVFEFVKACTEKHFNCFSISCLHCALFFFLVCFHTWEWIFAFQFLPPSTLMSLLNNKCAIICFISGKISIKFIRKMDALCAIMALCVLPFRMRMAVNFVYLLLSIYLNSNLLLLSNSTYSCLLFTMIGFN